MIFQQTLPSGVRVIAEPMPGYRSVSMGVWVATGSVCERPEEAGVSHFIEHMLFKGTKNRTAAQIAAEMDAVGGNLNAFTAKECTCFYAKVLPEHLPLAADMLSDLVRNAKLDEGDIEREKGVVCEEILMTEDNPEDLVHEVLCTAMYGDAPLAPPILGSERSVRALTRADIVDYMDRQYGRENILVSCAGNFERQALLDALSASFASWQSGAAKPLPKSALRGGRLFTAAEKDVEQVHLCLGLPGFARDTDEQYALYVLSNALGGSMSSRLFQKIREEKGLAYSVYSYPSPYESSGYFALYAGTGEKQAPKVLELMLREMADIRKNGLSEEEFVRAKEQLKGSYLLGQESTSGRASAIGKSVLLKGKVESEDEVLAHIEAVSMQAVREIVPVVLDTAGMTGAFVGRVDGQRALLERIFMEG